MKIPVQMGDVRTCPLFDCVFVGQAASADSDPNCPLSGRSGRKVADMLGMNDERWMECKRVNLNHDFPGRWPDKLKGDFFRAREGEDMAHLLLCMHWTKYVLIGRHVQLSFKVEANPLCTIGRGDKWFFCLPHPSGLNLWYNSAANVQNAERALRKFVYEN